MEQHLDQDVQGSLDLSETGMNSLKGAARWARFQAIVVFVMCCLGIIGMLVALSLPGTGAMQTNGFQALGLIFTIPFIAVAVIPYIYMYRFGNHARRAVETRSAMDLDQSIHNLFKHYRFIGVLMVIMIALYILSILGMIIGSSMM